MGGARASRDLGLVHTPKYVVETRLPAGSPASHGPVLNGNATEVLTKDRVARSSVHVRRLGTVNPNPAPARPSKPN